MRAVLAVAGVLTLSACSAPHPLSVGVKDIATDIRLTRATAAPTPSPGTGQPGFPIAPVPSGNQGGGQVVVPLPSFIPQPPPPPTACPTANPLTGASHPATVRPQSPPLPGTYSYLVDGTYSVTGTHPAHGSYPESASRKVHDIATTSDGYTFQMSDDSGLTVAYHVVPEPVGSAAVPGNGEQTLPVQAGIYVSSFTYHRTDGTTLSLKPSPEVMVAKLPFAAGDTWASKGVDPTSGVAVVVNGQTGLGEKKSPLLDRIDACGTVLDAYWVEYTVDTSPLTPTTSGKEPPSEISGNGVNVTFVGTRISFGSQYGGLPLHEIVVLKGTDGGDTVTIRRESTIRSEPRRAGP